MKEHIKTNTSNNNQTFYDQGNNQKLPLFSKNMSIKSNTNDNSTSTHYKSTLTSIRGHTYNTKIHK